ncbi:DUF2235 domain-containing protein [Chryseobacterium sp. SN22]|uniref:T6SS phospholipase effector Tle1-like catalytic domain-containing protein n=1 Tax=Chryseobacterium sp. SN22 TaxID=2606431 RepID=UPI0011EC6AC3|nr:DUF2235 domain-containing protein [Chryseobacterium sp. SN22]KAA0130427.1 DUF2235 domain-containing protein [Chryseobacterium sp. SN22]
MNCKIISIGVFFDGTGNNGPNAVSLRKPDKNNESYYGGTTNIYKLFNLFNGDEKIYIEGIGTVTGSEDQDFTMATCKNPSGVSGYSSDDKLEKASSFVRNLLSGNAAEYHFYVYGFSRGAMLARHLCYELLREYSEFLGFTVKVKFLGIFDTVESAAFSSHEVAILPKTERVLQISALNECRFFFPLTGLSEDSKEKSDTCLVTEHSVWKEIFVPGSHADVGGGYLEGSQSVYVSPAFTEDREVFYYMENIRATIKNAEGNKIWDDLLSDYGIDHDGISSQAYIAKEWVYNGLPKVYGQLMIAETNAEKPVFRTDFSLSDFEIEECEHPCLIELSQALQRYIQTLSPDTKPVYHYAELSDYTHISANFGLYHEALLQHPKGTAFAEFINNGLNVPGHSNDHYHKNGSRSQLEIHHIEDSAVDYAYGTNIPNNDYWNRTILMKESVYNKC